ncbi:hypothetical protein [Geobacter sp. AOG2]|uniref:hypothetical protein n=1 Tax=Geobacter sp. AOG2 TaxID=1566347 RepID=UPI00208153EB|nr:hypothetical protein [Geobacter sp. AOG2]GFE62722.1 hypothetical protein AOG2_33100 [Geobacter sp. AOG2]
MAFSLNKSLTHLEIKEPDLSEIYRSSNSAVPPEEHCQGHPCEAFVCAAREEDRFCVYIAFFDTTTQRSIILSTACDARKPADQKRLVGEALKLTKSMGFDMEPVKLDYSAAMRQVIIRGISVMRPPSHRHGKQHAKAAAPPAEPPRPAAQAEPAPAAPKASPSETPSPEVDGLAAQVADLKKALADMEQAKAEAEQAAQAAAAAETAALAAQVADLKKTLADREQAEAEAEQAAQAAAAAEIAALAAQVDDLKKALADREQAEAEAEKTAQAAAAAEIAALAAQVDDLKKALADMELAKAETERTAEQAVMAVKLELEKTVAAHRDREAALREEAAGRREEPPETTADAGLHAELADTTKRLGDLEEALDREAAQRREAEAKAEELDHRLERSEEEAAELRRELERLQHDTAAERLNAEQQLSKEIAGRSAEELAATEREQSLRDELAAARHENGAVQDTLKNVLKEQQVLANEREALRAELAVLRESAGLSWQQEREGFEQEREGLHDSVRRLESELSETQQRFEALLAEKELEVKEARAGLESLSARQEQLLGEKKLWDTLAGNFKKKAQKAVERLKREKQALEEKLKEAEQAPPPAPSPYPRSAAEVPAVVERHVESPFAALGLTDGGSGFAGFGSFGASAPGSGLAFRHAPDMAVISYHSPDDIVELYGSANVVQAAPEGRRSQLCGAYVCVVEQGGKTAIHLAWHLIDSGEVLICLPERQPEGAANYARALQDAIFYFESVGFMMDRFELSRNSHRQLKALEKIGICRLDEPAAAGDGTGGKASGDGGAMPAAA